MNKNLKKVLDSYFLDAKKYKNVIIENCQTFEKMSELFRYTENNTFYPFNKKTYIYRILSELGITKNSGIIKTLSDLFKNKKESDRIIHVVLVLGVNKIFTPDYLKKDPENYHIVKDLFYYNSPAKIIEENIDALTKDNLIFPTQCIYSNKIYKKVKNKDLLEKDNKKILKDILKNKTLIENRGFHLDMLMKIPLKSNLNKEMEIIFSSSRIESEKMLTKIIEKIREKNPVFFKNLLNKNHENLYLSTQKLKVIMENIHLKEDVFLPKETLNTFINNACSHIDKEERNNLINKYAIIFERKHLLKDIQVVESKNKLRL